jgi:hypothetical protein
MSKKPKALKSAFELAMERLEAEDARQGRRRKPLSDRQKTEIRELRAEAQAKLAEIEILHREQLAELKTDPERAEERKELEERYEIDRRRIESNLESKIERVKGS